MADDPRRQPSDRWLAIKARQGETGATFMEAAAVVDAERAAAQTSDQNNDAE